MQPVFFCKFMLHEGKRKDYDGNDRSWKHFYKCIFSYPMYQIEGGPPS